MRYLLCVCVVLVGWMAGWSASVGGVVGRVGGFVHAQEAPEQAAPGVRRVALVAAAHNGGEGRTLLVHAGRDAQKFAQVMQDLGGVAADDTFVLLDPGEQALREGFDRLQARLLATQHPGERVEVIFYYSGHSDEQGLLLGEARMGYRELRASADALSADIKIMVLDSCSAGALTRAKGGAKQPPFLVGEASDVSGHAFLTSSSENETAQESDTIGGSFFTHYLVTGLRGAADVSADGRVTLSEAYQFAFQETLRRTESTRSGPQHPVYEIQLTGTSDLVLTDLRAPSATLRLPEALEGRVFVHRDQPGAELVAELGKGLGRRTDLKLPADSYLVRVDRGLEGGVSEARFTVGAGQEQELSPDLFAMLDREDTTARGGGASPALADDLADGAQFSEIPLHVGFVTGLGVNDWMVPDGKVPLNNVAINVLVGGVGKVDGVAAAGLVSWSSHEVHGVQVAGLGNVSHAPTHGAQAAGIFNVADASTHGVQAAGIFNVNDEFVRGVQAAGIFNASPHIRGVQAAGIVNVSDAVDGVQAAGIVNIGGNISGAQIGLINIGDNVSGAQVGLINIADHSDAPIGLINIIGDGIHEASVWSSETAHINAGFKLGGRYFYGIISGGAYFRNQEEDDAVSGSGDALIEVGMGFGGRIPLIDRTLHLDIDLMHSQFSEEDRWYNDMALERLRLSVGWTIMPHLSVFAGASFNALIQWDTDSVSLSGGLMEPYVVYDAATDGPLDNPDDPTFTRDLTKVSLFPGFFAGVAF